MVALLAFAACRLDRQDRQGASSASAPEEALDAHLSPLSVAGALQAPDPRGFARALAPRPFSFPADHGPHPDFRTEWWYYTGNLVAHDGRRFGFQLTFFRVALAPATPKNPENPETPETPKAPSTPKTPAAEASHPAAAARTSAWATRQIYFAHLAITDVAGRRFRSYERWERQALGLAGAQASPFRIWVGDWSAAAAAPPVTGTPLTPSMRLMAASQGEAALDLTLTPSLPPVPQGDHGLSAKSAEPGNASYYYSLPRLTAAGTLRLGAESVAVTGLAWMDREWSTSSLGPGEVGWDWFALQLDDGWELMLYRLRRAPTASPGTGGAAAPDGADPASRATLIAPDGHTELFPPAAWRLEEAAHWTSPETHARYPSGWRLTIPGAGSAAALDLMVHPVIADQELRLSLRYWEGAVDAHGTHAGRPVAGRGYVELTGYADRPPPATLPRTRE